MRRRSWVHNQFQITTGKIARYQCQDAYTSRVTPSSTWYFHYNDATMSTIASQITSLTIVYSIVYSGADLSKHQSSASQAFVWGIHRSPVNSPHKWPVTRKMFPFDDVIMLPRGLLLTTLIQIQIQFFCEMRMKRMIINDCHNVYR